MLFRLKGIIFGLHGKEKVRYLCKNQRQALIMKRKYHYTISLSDIGADYEITINAVLGFFQDAIARHMSSGYVASFDVRKKGMLWMINEFHASLAEQRPFWSQEIDVEVFVSELSSVRVYVDFHMTDARGRLFSEGSSVWLLVEKESRRPVLTRSVPELVGLYDAAETVLHERSLFPPEGELIRSTVHPVTATDIDFNGHVNNQSYVRLAVAMAPVEFLDSHIPCDMHVKFLQESFLGDTLECRLSYGEGDSYVVRQIRQSDGKPVCQVVSRWLPAKAKAEIDKEIIR